jgi:hypothetical protein
LVTKSPIAEPSDIYGLGEIMIAYEKEKEARVLLDIRDDDFQKLFETIGVEFSMDGETLEEDGEIVYLAPPGYKLGW